MATRIIIYSIKFLRSTGIPRNFERSSGSPGYSIQTWLNQAFLQNSYQVKVSTPAALGRAEMPSICCPTSLTLQENSNLHLQENIESLLCSLSHKAVCGEAPKYPSCIQRMLAEKLQKNAFPHAMPENKNSCYPALSNMQENRHAWPDAYKYILTNMFSLDYSHFRQKYALNSFYFLHILQFQTYK